MEHVDHCKKCGKEVITEDNDDKKKEQHPDEEICDTCGEEVYDEKDHPEFEVDGKDDTEHPVEKGLRKVTDAITGDKKKI